MKQWFMSGVLGCVAALGASAQSTITVTRDGAVRTYELSTTASLRDHRPPEQRVVFTEDGRQATVRSGNVMFDGLYALAVTEAEQNSVAQIQDGAYGHGTPLPLDVYQTGEFWTYVWTRDLSYSLGLALASFNPPRAVNSLLFKASGLKASVGGGNRNQLIQDTGSGGSYPVSSDRVIWALGANETLKYLPAAAREKFLRQVYPFLHDTIEQDRRLIFDPADGLYRGEQSFLDWREQSYPGWTKDHVLPIALSKSLSVNAADYFLLQTAAADAERLGLAVDAARYRQWAAALKVSVNTHFYDAEAGLYSTYLLSDGVAEVRVHRYDLLGESLAILFHIADRNRAETVLEHYPVGPFGPAVVWPQERTVPIYHNQAIWPFVTAYWTKAARLTGYVPAVDEGIASLENLAAANLSNMENYDFVSGQAQVTGQTLNGPVINSRRQLWSVAGYLSMVQDVVFGLETTWDGLRFRPMVTATLRKGTFADSALLEWRHFNYCDTANDVRIHLPPVNAVRTGVCPIDHIQLNGRDVGERFVTRATLQSSNQWDIYLGAATAAANTVPLHWVEASYERARFGPAQPVWEEDQGGGITLAGGKLTLHFQDSEAANVTFNIYRDGRRVQTQLTATNWTDAASGDYLDRVHHYAVEAVDRISGNASHLSPFREYLGEQQQMMIPARDLANQGGNLAGNHHFENWGKPGDTLRTPSFQVPRDGHYTVRAEFSNGAGPINTGITCAVKRLELRTADTAKLVAAGYLVMPQAGDWQRWDWSSPVAADLVAGQNYVMEIRQDEFCRNMSCLQNNERYTAGSGGGTNAYDYVNIAALQLVFESATGK